MTNLSTIKLLDLIKKPIITDKTTKILEDNQYCFKVDKSATKVDIKYAIEVVFEVKVCKINILNLPVKIKTVGKITGKKAQYKKAIIKLSKGNRINIFPEN
uniref:Large ribosomal subunit protein uL23c n=1 Tax=Kumanoa americana TaxID=1196377 RepID=A0A1C9CGV0_9FLOR|nr:ribosomal protein L23 [Kumanoa americana]AOM67630.1 ribosomal protein L23 [Kumanoa americana]